MVFITFLKSGTGAASNVPLANSGLMPIVGPTGPRGATGPIGLQGPTGADGIQGPTGPAFSTIGKDTQILYNHSGQATGSDSLVYNYLTNTVTTQNITVQNTIYTPSGCFINSIRNVVPGTGPTIVKYNSTTNELSYVNNRYVYAYDTTTQEASGAGLYNAITFNTNEILVGGWSHTTGTSDFTVNLNNAGYFTIIYNLQVVCNTNSNRTMGVYIDLDGAPVKGSFRTVSMSNINNEMILTNSSIVSLSAGSHTIKLLMTQNDPTNGLTVQPSALLTGPDGSVSSATINITRVA